MSKLENKIREMGFNTISYEYGYFEIENTPYSVSVENDDRYYIVKHLPSKYSGFTHSYYSFDEAVELIGEANGGTNGQV